MNTLAANKNKTKIKRLYRSDLDKKICGVCGGIAEYFEVDSSLIRIAWIVATFLTGIIPGIVAYFVAAIVVPRQDNTKL